MDIDWTDQLVDQMEWQWGILRPRLDDLTDEQYLWEPGPGCWSVRRREDATSPMAAGVGDTVIDFALPEPQPAPLTTIAWRIGHLAMVFGQRTAAHFGAGDSGAGTDEVSYETVDWQLTAAGGLALLDHWHEAWVDGVRALDAEGLAAPCGPTEGPYADHPFATLVLHINREVLHHGAEIALLLDLFTHRAGLVTADGVNADADRRVGASS